MNHAATSRSELLKAAEKIVMSEGAQSLNIRRLAKECGIATGSVYNYFPSKSQLLFAVVEEFWKRVFHPQVCQMQASLPFPEFFQEMYGRFSQHLEEFRVLFRGAFSAMEQEEKVQGKEMEEKYMAHVRQGFLTALEQDQDIPPSVWSESFTKGQLVDFLFFNMLNMLGNGETDCSYLTEMLRRLLRQNERCS